jgi:hypothetical protein
MDNLAFSSELPYCRELQDPQSQMPSPVSPGKRKYDEGSDGSVEASSRHADAGPRWGGMSPTRPGDDVLIQQRELNGSDDSEINGSNVRTISYEIAEESRTSLSDGPNVLMSHDPHGLTQLAFPGHANLEAKELTDPEMQEKKGLYPLLPSAMEDVSRQSKYSGSMDVDDLARETHARSHTIDLTKDRAELE